MATISPSQVVDRALEMNISIKQSKLNYAGSEIEKQGAIGNFLPNINIGSSHSWNVGLNQNITTGLLENVTTQFSSMNLNMNINIYIYKCPMVTVGNFTT